MSETTANTCRVTLVGPSGRSTRSSMLRLKPWSRGQWRKLVVEVRVGTERWPTWDSANVCLSAIKDLVKLSDGLLSDEVVNALSTHVDVVSYETFRGPLV
jgi:hypothetical protein